MKFACTSSRAACSSGSTRGCPWPAPSCSASTAELALESTTPGRPFCSPGSGWSADRCSGGMSCFLPIGQADESVAEVGEHVRGGVTHQAHAGDDLAVVHAGRPDHPDRTPHPIGHLVSGQHQAAFSQPAAGVLAPDDDLDLLLELDLLQDARQLGALLEQFHELFEAADLDEFRVPKQIAHAIMEDHRLSLRLMSGDRRDQPLDDPALLSPVRTELVQAPRKFVGSLALDLLVQHGGHPAQVLLGGHPLEMDDLLLDEVAL